MDDGRREVDKLLQQMEREIQNIYKQAYQETWQKAQDYMQQFRQEDIDKRKWVQSGKWTKQQYQDWRRSKLLTGKRWYDMSTVLAKDFTHSNEIACSVINGHLPDVYAIGANYSLYQASVIDGLGMDFMVKGSFVLYNRNAVEYMLRVTPDLIPQAKIDIPKSTLWNNQKINSVMIQGILQGDSIDGIADRLQTVSNMNRSTAIRNARTLTTSAENGGRYYRDMELRNSDAIKEYGIEYEKEWISTLDDRTRDSHRIVDGEIVDDDKEFGNGLLYPGDPAGEPEEIYNCRCTYNRKMKKIKYPERIKDGKGKLGDMPYKDWKKLAPTDEKQYREYRDLLGSQAPQSVDDFLKIKYSDKPEWDKLKKQARQERKRKK